MNDGASALIWQDAINALSLLVEQTDAKGQLTTITYNTLGAY